MPDALVDEPVSTEGIGRPARQLLRRAARLRSRARALAEREQEARRDVLAAHAVLHQRAVRRQLAELPLSAIQQSAGTRIRLDGLEQAGYRSVHSLRGLTQDELDAVPGIGPATAARVLTAVHDLAEAVESSTRVRIDLDPSDQAATRLLAALAALDRIERQQREAGADHLEADLGRLAAAARPLRGRIRWFFTRDDRRAAAAQALADLEQRTRDADQRGVSERLDEALRDNRRGHPDRVDPDELWRDFEQRSPEYYGLLGSVVDPEQDQAATHGFMPAELAQTVLEQPLDTGFLEVPLRAYQAFGARFALVQRRVVLGDEMGLGKTIQALAVIAHLAATRPGPVLVVCPASLLVNWTREIATRTKLTGQLVYGTDRADDLRSWLAEVSPADEPGTSPWGDAGSLRPGAIAVTTYESLRTLALPEELRLAALVVDEAHYVKNPEAARTQAVSRWAACADRVLFMTGTPMENRIGEFRDLIGLLQPALAGQLELRHGAAGANAFRQAVADVYLRRNAEDVLTELPDLVEVQEWEPFSRKEFEAYRQAVGRHRFGEMRRIAWTADPAGSGKLDRLIGLLDEAAENYFKVVVFSFYRDVIDVLMHEIADRRPTLALHGPLTGSTPAAQRQALVDAFSAEPAAAVLVSQIQAGGVGLNMQAASVVIICEPQIKPTTEDQAIARAHRMGQVRSVRVHRLLTPGSVDERLLEILAEKSRLFDEYARRSDLAESTPEAIDGEMPEVTDLSDGTDPSAQTVIRQVLEAEQARLGVNPGPTAGSADAEALDDDGEQPHP